MILHGVLVAEHVLRYSGQINLHFVRIASGCKQLIVKTSSVLFMFYFNMNFKTKGSKTLHYVYIKSQIVINTSNILKHVIFWSSGIMDLTT